METNKKIKKRKLSIKKLTIFIIICCIIVCFVILFSGEEKMVKSRYDKILLIGIDAMDPKVTDKLMSEGMLPNFLRLKEIGSFSKLSTVLPAESPVAWTTIATGTNPGKHGLFDFVTRNPENYLLEVSITKQKSKYSTKFESPVKGIPFWRITSDAKIPTTVIRWPATFPPDKVNGVMFSGEGVPDIRGFSSGYYIYTSEGLDEEKKIKVSVNDGMINSKVFGPLGTDRKSIEKSIQIKVDKDKATIIVDNKEYPVDVGGWSDWIRIDFKVGFMKKVSAIAKAYLFSIEPEFNMYLSSIQIDPENPVVDFSYPSKYSKELADAIGLYNTLGMPEDTNALNENAITDKVFLEQVAQIEDERNKMFWYEFNRFDKGVLAFVFDSGDRLQHMHWDEKNLFNVEEGLSVNKEVIDYYIKKDKLLEEVLNKIDNKTALMVFSDHGFTSFERAVSINTWLVENGFMTLTNDYNENDEGALFKFVDWSKTKAYSLGFAGIYINLKGREGQGIVEEAEKEEVINNIIKKLEDFKDPKNNQKVITNAYKREEIYDGDYVEDAPDIVIGFEPGYRMSWQSAIGGLTPEPVIDNLKRWNGDHIVDPSHVPGVLFTNFKINNENPSLLNIAPTVLDILKIEIPKEMDGESLV
ncbi:hypothetical protein AUJ83_04450 [Candidatus Woesearchaeota archaeon CG1_02_33_12]|nr:MAG: hypothetical protein AUJ83_04450 [Candidatus Woesearchaeota archaeon CG1_02_33_12]PIN78334.1 MAG: hypothetical protein COV14_04015 [Candidatus Woesearchaeota archaeon CG10_big_fil_rev_8_21_14_0_10_33_12]PIU72846.1 MAG: hypothetical protein COS79_00815 [Candidatus Woesearchaeota archaeon CG06_land_8_20_14_3_00_33_13]